MFLFINLNYDLKKKKKKAVVSEQSLEITGKKIKHKTSSMSSIPGP